jgi:hypothetical protein
MRRASAVLKVAASIGLGFLMGSLVSVGIGILTEPRSELFDFTGLAVAALICPSHRGGTVASSAERSSGPCSRERRCSHGQRDAGRGDRGHDLVARLCSSSGLPKARLASEDDRRSQQPTAKPSQEPLPKQRPTRSTTSVRPSCALTTTSSRVWLCSQRAPSHRQAAPGRRARGRDDRRSPIKVSTPTRAMAAHRSVPEPGSPGRARPGERRRGSTARRRRQYPRGEHRPKATRRST